MKSKHNLPSPAKDLYTSALFRKERDYAEQQAVPWFILSAKHGLVAPDEWLEPYDVYLARTPPAYRRKWGLQVVERLESLLGPLDGKTIEIHASDAYASAVRAQLKARGVTVLEPLQGLGLGKRLAWYGSGATHEPKQVVTGRDTPQAISLAGTVLAHLSNPSLARTPEDLLRAGRVGLQTPGLYSWWVDDEGAKQLSRGLGMTVTPGLIYAGLAGATRSISMKSSSNTLWGRIVGMHLGKNHNFSTFRHTLGSILETAQGRTTIDEEALTRWMHAHLRVVTVPASDPDTLDQLESAILGYLDPPLNLRKMQNTPLRLKLSELRRGISGV